MSDSELLARVKARILAIPVNLDPAVWEHIAEQAAREAVDEIKGDTE